MKGVQKGQKIRLGWRWITDGLLCLLLTSMIGLACLQIALRTFFSGGFLWSEPLLRYLVIWSGMLGAVTATRERKHIAIDVITYLAPEKIKKWIYLIINLFSCVVAGALTLASVIFVRNEALSNSNELLNIPIWAWNLIFPIAFGMITFHFLLALIIDISPLFGKTMRQPTGNKTEATSE